MQLRLASTSARGDRDAAYFGPRRACPRCSSIRTTTARRTLKKSVAVPLLDAVRVSSSDSAGPGVDVLTSPGAVWETAIPPSHRPLTLAAGSDRSPWPPGALPVCAPEGSAPKAGRARSLPSPHLATRAMASVTARRNMSLSSDGGRRSVPPWPRGAARGAGAASRRSRSPALQRSRGRWRAAGVVRVQTFPHDESGGTVDRLTGCRRSP